MDYRNKKSLRKSIIGFLRQRRRAYQVLRRNTGRPDLIVEESYCDMILQQLDMIREMNYWRHCREMILREEQIKRILPSQTGKHYKIRLKVLQLIEHCRMIQNIPASKYQRYFSEQLPL